PQAAEGPSDVALQRDDAAGDRAALPRNPEGPAPDRRGTPAAARGGDNRGGLSRRPEPEDLAPDAPPPQPEHELGPRLHPDEAPRGAARRAAPEPRVQRRGHPRQPQPGAARAGARI